MKEFGPSLWCLSPFTSVQNYKVWEQQHDFYLVPAKVTEKDEGIQVVTFLHIVGPQKKNSLKIFNF